MECELNCIDFSLDAIEEGVSPAVKQPPETSHDLDEWKVPASGDSEVKGTRSKPKRGKNRSILSTLKKESDLAASTVSDSYRSETKEPEDILNNVIFECKPIFVYGIGIDEPMSAASLNDVSYISNRVMRHLLRPTNAISTPCTYAWPTLIRGNSLISIDTVDQSEVYLPAVCKSLKMNKVCV